MAATTHPMSFAEFEQLPEQPGKQELINGELIIMPPPENRHSMVSKRIFRMLLNSLPEERVWGDHTGYRVGGGWIEPDASISWPDQPQDDKYLLRAPMIAAEILSPGEDIEEKLTLYFDEGALEVWVINIRKKTMTVYRRSDQSIIRLKVEDEYRCETIGVTISLAELFA
jgi:Uma2 family endonuclease